MHHYDKRSGIPTQELIMRCPLGECHELAGGALPGGVVQRALFRTEQGGKRECGAQHD